MHFLDFSSSQNCENLIMGPDDEINAIKNTRMGNFLSSSGDLLQSCPVIK